MHIFYTPQIANGQCTLSEEESKHCIKVLRLVPGDKVQLIDGVGGYHTAEIADPNPKRCTLNIIDTINNYEQRPYRIHIAIAPTKNIDRTEWFVEKAVEIGIDEITMLVSQHSERRNVNLDRIEKIIVSAMKQSVKAYKPVLNDITPFDKFVKTPRDGRKLIAHCIESEKHPLKAMVDEASEYTVLIGPEGDFSPEEVALAEANGYSCIDLGPYRLRTETAALVACHTINLLKQ
ncbi:MAG: 16S rRNA (uracil(1498)-N(3))-methyltransferase [Salinivirgaceae bacterium]|nr:16S rRNA (uracil(1498)-N(3))-methyltransferase [Salinivirgaceae bacterium]